MVNGEKSLADILIEIVKEFNKNKINYVIIGGFAMVFHGMPRFTEDIDIAIDIDEKNLKKIKISLQKLFNDNSFDEIRKSDFEKYSVIRYGTPNNFYIDFIYQIGEIADFEILLRNTKIIYIDDTKIPILNEKMLIKLKQNTLRDRDKNDANFLMKKLQGEKNGI